MPFRRHTGRDEALQYGVVARIRRGLAFGQEEAVEGGS
jgi:hypothetical protein